QISIEERIRHVARDRLHREAARREVRSAGLPISEVTGDQNESFLTSEPLLDDAPPFDLFEERDDALAAVERKDRSLRGCASEMPVARLRDTLYLVMRQLGKRGAHLTLDDLAADRQRAVT